MTTAARPFAERALDVELTDATVSVALKAFAMDPAARRRHRGRAEPLHDVARRQSGDETRLRRSGLVLANRRGHD